MLGTILLVVLILLLLGALPAWPHSRGWGYYPSGGLGLVLLIVIIVLLLARRRCTGAPCRARALPGRAGRGMVGGRPASARTGWNIMKQHGMAIALRHIKPRP
jgi:hypothetical protein